MRRAAIVTGSDSGIGRAAAVALAEAGFDVGVTWHSDEAGAAETARAANTHGARVVLRRLDVSRPEEAQAVVADAIEELGGLCVFVNNAGLNHRAHILDETLEDWRRVLDVNLTGAFSCAQAAARHMVNADVRGRIVNVTSVHEHVPLHQGAAYCAAKAGLGLLTRAMALDLAPYGITVNAVAPGHVATAMNGYPEGASPVPRPGIPLQRIGLPEEVAAAVAWLADARTGYVTGASIVVDGGLLQMATATLQAAVEAP